MDNKTIDRVIESETEELRKLGESCLVSLPDNKIRTSQMELIDAEIISSIEEIGEKITKLGTPIM